MTDDRAAGAAFRERFTRQLPSVPLVLVESPYRELVRPLIRFSRSARRRRATT